MRRRDFLKRTTAAAAGTVAATYVLPVCAQARKDTLLTLSEGGPNNLDVMGVGTNRPGYEASWNTYDRLVTYGVKRTPTATTITTPPKSRRNWPSPGISATCRSPSNCARTRNFTTALR